MDNLGLELDIIEKACQKRTKAKIIYSSIELLYKNKIDEFLLLFKKMRK